MKLNLYYKSPLWWSVQIVHEFLLVDNVVDKNCIIEPLKASKNDLLVVFFCFFWSLRFVYLDTCLPYVYLSVV